MNTLIICFGVMYGTAGANNALKAMAKALGVGVEKQLLKKALTKGTIYPIVKSVAKWFGIKMTIPSYVSVHFVRHHIGVNHYVQSQRNDRQTNYDRTKAPQDTMVSHIMSVNAQELVFMSHKRLCRQASKETREVMEEIVRQVSELNPEFAEVLVPLCGYRNGVCTEFNCCGYNRKYIKGGDSDG